MVAPLSQLPSPPNSRDSGYGASCADLSRVCIKRSPSPLDPLQKLKDSPSTISITSTSQSTPVSSHATLFASTARASMTGVLPSIDSLARSISGTGREGVSFNLSTWAEHIIPPDNASTVAHAKEPHAHQSRASPIQQSTLKYATDYPIPNGQHGWVVNSHTSVGSGQPIYPNKPRPPPLQEHYHFSPPRHLSFPNVGTTNPFQQSSTDQLPPQGNAMFIQMPFSISGPRAAGQQMILQQGMPSTSVGPAHNNSLLIGQGVPTGYPLASPVVSPTEAYFDESIKRLPKRRTKTGCLTCRKRRIKCDERKPFCFNCEKSKKVCTGFTHLCSSSKPDSPSSDVSVADDHPGPPRRSVVEKRGRLDYIIN